MRRVVLMLVAAAALAGCGGVRVRSVANPAGPTWELHGASAAELQAEAERLCAKGHTVLRQSAQGQRDAEPALAPLRRIGDAAVGAEPDRAQLVVQCLP